MTSDLSDYGLTYINGHIPPSTAKDWYVFSVVRNEILRLPYFLKYYREMGTKLFIIADNNSMDGSVKYLQNQPDVLLFNASGRYSESTFGVSWLNALLDTYGHNRWCLTVDADELLVFPHSEQLDLMQLTQYLDAQNTNALPSFLLDMYSKEPICDTNYQSGQPFLEICPYFDANGYIRQKIDDFEYAIPIRGGPRSRLFWEGYVREKPTPYLFKIPLVRWSSKLQYIASTHVLQNARLGDISGALLHFKFFSDFPIRVQEEIERQEHFNGASQYSVYGEVLAQQSELSAYYPDSVHYKDTYQLMMLDLIYTTSDLELLAKS